MYIYYYLGYCDCAGKRGSVCVCVLEYAGAAAECHCVKDFRGNLGIFSPVRDEDVGQHSKWRQVLINRSSKQRPLFSVQWVSLSVIENEK